MAHDRSGPYKNKYDFLSILHAMPFKKRPFIKGTDFDSSTVFSSKDVVIKVSFSGKDANHTDPVTSPWEGEKKLIAEYQYFCLLVFISVLEVHNELKRMSRKS